MGRISSLRERQGKGGRGGEHGERKYNTCLGNSCKGGRLSQDSENLLGVPGGSAG